MVAIPTAPTWSVGEIITDVDLQALSDYCKFVMETRPICYLVQQAAQSGWTSATMTSVTFGSGSEVLDTDAQHSTSSNTSRVVIGNTLGFYRVSGVYAAPANTNTVLTRSRIALNGTGLAASQANSQWSSFSGTAAIVTGTVVVEATSSADYVELQGLQQASAGTIGTGVATDIASLLLVEYIKKP